jgi:hypothetical protein
MRSDNPRLGYRASCRKREAGGGPKRFDKLVAFCYRIGMSQPVKVSDALLLDARVAGEAVERSIAGQIEFWAKIGRALEPLLRGDHVLALCRYGDVKPLSARLTSVDSPAGRKRVLEHLKTRPYPHYEAADSPGLLVRIEADGARTVGRFVNRQFQPVKVPSKKKVKPVLTGVPG